MNRASGSPVDAGAVPWAPLVPLLREKGLDAIVLNSFQAVTYFAGSYLLSQLMLPDRLTFFVLAAGRPALVVCSIEASQARSQSPVEEVVEYVEFVEEPERALARTLRNLLGDATDAAHVGIEGRRMPAHSRDALAARIPGIRFSELDVEIEVAQTVKAGAVRDALGVAARATQQAIETAVAAVDSRGTELDLASTVVAGLARAGGTPVFCFLGSGARALHGHPEPTASAFATGEIWRADVGARFDGGVLSDVARCGVVGVPSAEQRRAFSTVHEAQLRGFDTLRPGARAGDVYAAVEAVMRGSGYDWGIPHVGHGLGVGVHEQPILAPGNDLVLEPGMVVNIEPILLLAERGEAYHTEDLAVVTDDGCRLLTTPQRELLRIDG